MELEYCRVPAGSPEIRDIYDILRLCGEDMYENQGLCHWRTPYPMDAIEKNCADHPVYLVKRSGESAATFQIIPGSGFVTLSKLAVAPRFSGRGIGAGIMAFLEKWCAGQGMDTIRLDVYDKSQHAIAFYLRHGFTVTGSAPTRHFRVLLMEKKLL